MKYSEEEQNQGICPEGWRIPKNSDFLSYFDCHWESNMVLFEDFLIAVRRVGFIVEEIKNISIEQLPFWKLSSAYSTFVLENNSLDENKKKRIKDSKNFHDAMANAYLKNDIAYYKIILKKQAL